jgi:hypothetical protein
MLSVILASALTSVVVGAVFFYFATHDQGRRLYSLECDMVDLQGKVLSEIKKRGINEHWDRKKQDKKLDEMMEGVKQPAGVTSSAPWWMAHVQPDLKK